MEKRKKQLGIVREIFLGLNREYLSRGVQLNTLKSLAQRRDSANTKQFLDFPLSFRTFAAGIFVSLICGVIIHGRDDLVNYVYNSRCYIPNNYLVWEFTRPVSDCDFCRGIDSAIIIANDTKEEFEKFAYSSRPIIVKRAIEHWRAAEVFSLEFFRDLYERIEGSYESVEEECQFLHFKSNFSSLKEVFGMSEGRRQNREGGSWYVGWKNCHPEVLEEMRKYYEPPKFLPDDAEVPQTNYVFLGYDEGAIMHLDYIPRLMWQGQILGDKTWTVAPTPECDNVCNKFNFSVNSGDVILLDTRLWYHATFVDKGQLSLTVTSEYG
ncbi:uncharacterized protein LOC107044966 isoform X2 [Diachasma alloeum]|uniref:uncharacterized protein LOC107044966 isoform X1 n=1 Tax=Diachasma alloeum TaxID=454923 RepID=UPI0007382FE7|nr:uncharacterized protein LOC107044966 isoform X1 [Diachasma alloeum]XP_015122535.1 uncharacterized protein LOC107044966 isoform X2 [Diachasma alloeum]